ncbi:MULTISPECIES: GNAT family N-acetyltransferase [Niastella]|uniref:GNAT family N-acetyltransferase n=1 Tax=Niastella soli TaxID=2821487 RepID=A0ABS3Z035_9BACT|nr:GNAT family N-acetyltransferase [Niastella soli]MBO9203127.1 GNAT family N-acetyltransferase [Niastella soli]
MTTLSPNSLCQSLDARKEQPIVFQKELVPGYHISLRPVSVHTDQDINAIHNWLSAGYGQKAGLPIDQLRVFFILMGESTYAQAFMVMLNHHTPIGQFEVYQVEQDELNDAIDTGESDYRMYIPVMPVIESHPDVTIQILHACLHYFFSFSEVNRIFWVVPGNDKERNRIAIKTEGLLYKTLDQGGPDADQPAKVYQYKRVQI